MHVFAYLYDFLVQMIKIIHIATIFTFTESSRLYVLNWIKGLQKVMLSTLMTLL